MVRRGQQSRRAEKQAQGALEMTLSDQERGSYEPENVGGYANVFTKGPHARVRHFAVMDATGALDVRDAEKLLDDEQPSPESTVGMFVDYLVRRKAGVLLPARLKSDGSDVIRLPRRQVELIETEA